MLKAFKISRLLQNDRFCYIFFYFGLIFVLIYQLVTQLASILVPRWIYIQKKNIKGQNILITGAGSGLGRQLAVEFSKHATCLLLVDINEESLQQTVRLLDGSSTVFTYKCDVSDYKEVYKMAVMVEKDAGDVDILVNNAGVFTGKYLVDLPEATISRTMGVNTMAHFWTAKAFLPAMIKKNSGHLVCICSLVGTVPGPMMTDYCASKFAAIGFAQSLEVEMTERKLDGIKVTIVCPAHMDTGLFEGANMRIGTILNPEHVAKEVVLAVLEERELLYLPAFTKFVPMILPCMPRWFFLLFMKISGSIKVMENFTGKRVIDVNG